MKIIIVGAGKTGATLAQLLTGEGHDVTVVDQNQDRVTAVSNSYDVMGIVGDGLNSADLNEAGAENADLLIAVTGSDEQNLLSCLFAQKGGQCDTIARIRDPMYLKETDFFKEHVGLSMVINPEHAAATEISRLLRFPSAVGINSLAKGRLELLTFRITENSLLPGKTLTEVRGKLSTGVLFCSVERKGEFIIPSGNFALAAGDKATIVIQQQDTLKFFRQIKLDTHSVKNVVIVGGGTISHYLARQLLENRISVKIIEQDGALCDTLSEELPGAMIIHGDATDKSLLLEEGIANADAFVALTGFDEENVLLSLYAKRMGCPKVVTKVDRPIFNELISGMDLDSVIYPHSITAENILQYVRARQNAMGNNIETLYTLVEDQVEALEFNISKNAPMLDRPIKELPLKSGLIICGILRGKRAILPDGNTVIQAGDRVTVVTSHKKLKDFKDILQ